MIICGIKILQTNIQKSMSYLGDYKRCDFLLFIYFKKDYFSTLAKKPK